MILIYKFLSSLFLPPNFICLHYANLYSYCVFSDKTNINLSGNVFLLVPPGCLNSFLLYYPMFSPGTIQIYFTSSLHFFFSITQIKYSYLLGKSRISKAARSCYTFLRSSNYIGRHFINILRLGKYPSYSAKHSKAVNTKRVPKNLRAKTSVSVKQFSLPSDFRPWKTGLVLQPVLLHQYTCQSRLP